MRKWCIFLADSRPERINKRRNFRFLDLEKQSPNTVCVPTLDIDFVWHTHQLMPTKYYTDMNLYLSRFLDQ